MKRGAEGLDLGAGRGERAKGMDDAAISGRVKLSRRERAELNVPPEMPALKENF